MAQHMWAQIQMTVVTVEAAGDKLNVFSTPTQMKAADDEASILCWFCEVHPTLHNLTDECPGEPPKQAP